ncbi:AMP dependent coa ligase, partial [Operophtera brumata]
APAELESILRSHPAVQDAAVIGVPHEFYGEAPKAFIIRKSGQTTSEEELQDFVAGQVAGYKKIEEVMFVQDIPKTASGKILRKDLKKIYA